MSPRRLAWLLSLSPLPLLLLPLLLLPLLLLLTLPACEEGTSSGDAAQVDDARIDDARIDDAPQDSADLAPPAETSPPDAPSPPDKAWPDKAWPDKAWPDKAWPDQSTECDPGCHWDCFYEEAVCAKGKVYITTTGALQCCKYGDPWPYPGPVCTNGVPLHTCSTTSCNSLKGSPYAHCLENPSGVGGSIPSTGFEHLLQLFCSSFAYHKPGDACASDADCRPADQSSAARLTCDLASKQCKSAPRPKAPAGYGGSCGLTVSYTTIGPVDQAMAGKTCALCHVIGDSAGTCLKQGCTTTCKFDEDCPAGSVCVCVGAQYQYLSQVCAAATGRDTPAARTAALKCYPPPGADGGADSAPALDAAGGG